MLRRYSRVHSAHCWVLLKETEIRDYLSLRDFLQMFISDWKSIRCEEVQKNTEIRYPPQNQKVTPRITLLNGVGRIFYWGGKGLFYSWVIFLPVGGIPFHSFGRSVVTHQFTSLEPHKRRLIALVLTDLIITLFYLAQFVVLSQSKH